VGEVIEGDVVELRVDAYQVSSALPTVTLSPSCGMTVNWLGKYSFLTAAWTALSVSPLVGIGSSKSQRWRNPSASGAFSGVAGFVSVGQETGAAAPAAIAARNANPATTASAGKWYLRSAFMGNSPEVTAS